MCTKFNYKKNKVAFVSERFPEQDGSILVMCMGLTSGLGRIIFGKLADLPRVDRILLQQVSALLLLCISHIEFQLRI